MLTALALSFVCLLPTCYSYDGILVRKVTLIEAIFSTFFAVITLIALPVFTAVKKKFWAMLGTAGFGLLAFLPGMFLPKMAVKLAAPDVSFGTSFKAFILKDIYIMMNAPFVGIGSLIGDKIALVLPKLILPLSLLIYLVVWLYRFYRDAYLNERLSPPPVNEPKVDPQTRKPDILGTVISAPVNPEKATSQAQPVTPPPAPAPQRAPAPQPRPQPRPQHAQKQVQQRPKPQPMPAPQPKPQVSAPQQAPRISDDTKIGTPVRPQPAPEAQEPSEPNPGVRKPNINVSFDTIELGAPEPKKDEAIQLGAPKNSEAIQLGAPAPKDNGAIQLGPPTDLK